MALKALTFGGADASAVEALRDELALRTLRTRLLAKPAPVEAPPVDDWADADLLALSARLASGRVTALGASVRFVDHGGRCRKARTGGCAMRKWRSAAVVVVALMWAAGSALPASAVKPPGDDSGEMVIYGGRTQSTDPTAYNYVPADSDGQIQPMGAIGTQYISPFTYTWGGLAIPVPSGQLHHAIDGSGRWIDREYAQYAPVVSLATPWDVNLCNWRIDFQNRRATNNSIAATWTGPTYSGCSTFNISRAKVGFSVVQGKQCARLYVNGVYRGEQCHAIY